MKTVIASAEKDISLLESVARSIGSTIGTVVAKAGAAAKDTIAPKAKRRRATPKRKSATKTKAKPSSKAKAKPSSKKKAKGRKKR